MPHTRRWVAVVDRPRDQDSARPQQLDAIGRRDVCVTGAPRPARVRDTCSTSPTRSGSDSSSKMDHPRTTRRSCAAATGDGTTFGCRTAARTGGVRAVWVVANHSALHTHRMSGTTTVTTFVTGAAAVVGKVFVSVFPHACAPVRPATGKERKVKRFGPTLLQALPFLVMRA